MAQSVPTAVVTSLVGGGILLVGYLVKYRRWTGLISESTALPQTDDSAPLTASLVGNVTLVVGAFVLALGGLQFLGLASLVPDWLWLLLLVGTVALVAPRLGIHVETD